MQLFDFFAPTLPRATIRDSVLTVSNEGAPVPADLLPAPILTFKRDHTGADGSGLGLAIANAVACGVGGKLVLTSPLPGRQSGFEASFSR